MKKELQNDLNKYLANTGVLYIKFHNLHWNVVGPQFKNVHEYLETIYDSFANILDEVAEMLKIHGKTPLASFKEFLEVSSVNELASKEIEVSQTLKIAKADIVDAKSLAESIRKMANDEDLYDVVAMLEGHLTNYNKTIWFLDSMTK